MQTCRQCKKEFPEAQSNAHWSLRAGFCSKACSMEYLRPFIPAQLMAGRFPRKFWSATLTGLDSKTKLQRAADQHLVAYASNWQRRWLLILGPVGTGKTWRAAAVAGEMSLFGVWPKYVTAQGFIESCQQSFRREGSSPESVRSDFLDKDSSENNLLVIDDLGAESNSDFSMEQLDALFDAAYGEESSLVVTSNLTLNQIAKRSARVADRLVGMCDVVRLDGTSRRIEEGPQEVPQMFYDEPKDSRNPITVFRKRDQLRHGA